LKFLIAGGDSSFRLVDDLKVRIAFNRFTGDAIVKTVFPNVNTNSDGNYEAIVDFAKTASAGNVLKSVVVESEKLSYVVYGIAALVVIFVVWMFAKK
jgi:hypothetical protein